MKRHVILLSLLLLLCTLCLVACGNDVCDECSFGEWSVTIESTCAKAGHQTRICTVCGHSETQPLDPEAHSFGEWLIVDLATCTGDGMRARTCVVCGAEETEKLPMLETVYVLTLQLGNETRKEPVPASGAYFLDTPEWEGLVFMGWVDEEGDPFPHTGTVLENKTLTAVWETVDTATFAELKARIEAGAKEIRLVDDIVLTDTIYVVGNTTIVLEKNCTLTRSPSHLGDLFVLGQHPNGDSVLLENRRASLTLCPENGATLTVDGNKNGISDAIGGSAFVILNSSTLNVCDNVVIVNCRKDENLLLAENCHNLSSPDRAGGAAVLILNGACHMYGGTIRDCEVSTDDEGIACLGGAVFNFGSFIMYGGTLEDNTAARGGALYNYRVAFLYGGTIRDNHASVYGGAMYQTDSQYTYSVLGREGTEITMTLEGNTSGKSGGAIFASHQSTVSILGGTLFASNQTKSGNGGAINMAGELIIQYAVFTGNKASSKGGAIYSYYSKNDYSTRITRIDSGIFEGNEAPRGGAIGLGKGDDVETGAIAKIGAVIFRANHAPLNGNEEYGYGGAIHVDSQSTLSVSGGAVFTANTAADKGGVLYVTKSSTVTLQGSTDAPVQLTSNEAGGNGGALYLYTGTSATMRHVVLEQNHSASASYGGGALYLTGASCELEQVSFIGNTAYRGGAVGLYSASSLSAGNVTFSQNTASNRGGAVYASASTMTAHALSLLGNTADDRAGAIYLTEATLTANGVTVTDNACSNGVGGAFGVYSSSTVTLTDPVASGNTALDNGGFFYVSGSTVTVQASEAGSALLQANRTIDGNGGAFAVHSSGRLYLYGVTLCENAATAGNGGALYVYGAYATLGDAEHTAANIFTSNSAKKGGAVFISTTSSASTAVSAHTLTAQSNTSTGGGGFLYVEVHEEATSATATLDVVSVTLTNNSSAGNGGALYIYTGATATFGTVTATGNRSDKNGGVIYASGKSTTTIETVTAHQNSAASGGFLYLTTTGTTVTLNGGDITGNTADTGSAIYSNSAKSVLNIKGGESQAYLTFDIGSIAGKSGFAITEI